MEKEFLVFFNVFFSHFLIMQISLKEKLHKIILISSEKMEIFCILFDFIAHLGPFSPLRAAIDLKKVNLCAQKLKSLSHLNTFNCFRDIHARFQVVSRNFTELRRVQREKDVKTSKNLYQLIGDVNELFSKKGRALFY